MIDRKTAIWFGITTLLLGILIALADTGQLMRFIRTADRYYLLIALALGLGAVPVLANSWYQFINTVGGDQGFIDILKIFMAGNFVNAVTPLGQFGGEPFMAYVIKDNTDISYQQALSAVVSADIINTIPIFTYVFLGAIYMAIATTMNSFMIETLTAVIAFGIAGGALTAVLWFRPRAVGNMVLSLVKGITARLGHGQRYIGPLEERLTEIEHSFKTLGSSRTVLIETAIIAHLFFGFQILAFHFILLSLGQEAPLAMIAFLLPLASLSTFTPTPGGSGAYEATMTALLTKVIGILYTPALAAAVLYRVVTYWQDIILGYLAFTTIGVDTSAISDAITSENG